MKNVKDLLRNTIDNLGGELMGGLYTDGVLCFLQQLPLRGAGWCGASAPHDARCTID